MAIWQGRTPWLMACLGVVTGCCTVHGAQVADFREPTVRAGWAAAGIRDRRAEFQQVFCRHYAAGHEDDCGRWLAMPMDGPPEHAATAMPPPPTRRTVVFVPGIFGECVAPWVQPFSADYANLERLGYDVIVIPVEGRASSARNAGIIHATLLEHRARLADAVVIAYSKGVTDFMRAATQPEAAAWLDDVSALVSVAGTANGSPLASRGEGVYRSVLSEMPWATCGPSDGGGVSSITYREAMPVAIEFAQKHPDLQTYSVLAMTDPDHVNPVLEPFADYLDAMDRRNDGQVLAEDAIVPGSEVLGVFRADHWSIALPFSESDAWEMAPLGRNNAFPRGALIGALVEFTAPVAARQLAPARQDQGEGQ